LVVQACLQPEDHKACSSAGRAGMETDCDREMYSPTCNHDRREERQMIISITIGLVFAFLLLGYIIWRMSIENEALTRENERLTDEIEQLRAYLAIKRYLDFKKAVSGL
jgi:hypothetical protein